MMGKRPEIKHPAKGKLQLVMIHSNRCHACKETERAMYLWDFYHPEAPVRHMEISERGVNELVETYLSIEENGMKYKSLPVFYITWSERPRHILWHTTGGIDSRNPKQVNELYTDIEKGFEKARKVVNNGIREGIF